MKIEDYLISEQTTLASALKRLDQTGKRCIFAVDGSGRLAGSLSDGDVRRYILVHGTTNGVVADAMNRAPIVARQGDRITAVQALSEFKITAAPLLNGNGDITDILFQETMQRSGYRPLSTPLPVVMMAGGVGSRLMPLTTVLPKPLVPINGKPIAELIIDRFRKGGCDEFYLVLNYKKRMVKAYFEDVERDYSVSYIEESQYLGTGGGIKLVEPYISSAFFLTNCDVLVDIDLRNVYQAHKAAGNAITVICSLKNYTIPYGTIDISEGGEIVAMREKPTFSSLVNTGCYLVEPSVLSHIGLQEDIGFPDVVLRCQDVGMKVGAYPISEGSWLDMGEPEELERMSRSLNREQN